MHSSPRLQRKLVVLVCGGFVAACAASSQPVFRPPVSPQTQSQDCGDLHIQFSVRSDQYGTPTYQASIRDRADQPLTTITRVLFAFTSLPAPARAAGSTTTLTAQSVGDGRYASTGGFQLTAGSWQVEVIVRREPHPAPPTQALCAFRLTI